MPVDKFGRVSDAKTTDTWVSPTYMNNNYIRSDGSTPVSGSIDMKGNTLYNVSDPENRQDVATKQYVDTASKAFIFGNGRYMASGEVSVGGRRLNNVGMPIENHQASNKFYVDTIVETAITSDKALIKREDGTFASVATIDMIGNSIIGVPNPIDIGATANKNYVDSGGAIIKKTDGSFTTASDISINGFRLKNVPNPKDNRDIANKNYVDHGGAIVKDPDGSFTTVSDIDFIGFRLRNIPNPTDNRDAVNKAFVDKKVSFPSPIGLKHIITMWAEEKGPLGNGHYEFSFSNGSSGSEHAYGGYCMSAPGRIIRGSLTVTESKTILSEDVKVNIMVNGEEQVNQFIVKESGEI